MKRVVKCPSCNRHAVVRRCEEFAPVTGKCSCGKDIFVVQDIFGDAEQIIALEPASACVCNPLTDAQKLEAIESFLIERILQPIEKARESLESNPQPWSWRELQCRYNDQWVADGILEIIHGKETNARSR